MPFFPPPPIPKNKDILSSSDVWALTTFFLGLCTILATVFLYLMHLSVEGRALEADAKLRAAELELQAATAPVSTSIDCDFTIEGNLQFDGREVNATSAYRRTTSYDRQGRSSTTYEPLTTTYVGTDIPAGTINVPDFTQFKLTKITGHCNGDATLPARMIAEIYES